MTATKTAKPAKATPAKAAAPAAGVDPVTDYRVQLIALADIDVSLNPRTSFEDEAVAELAASIQAVGLAQPITVEDTGGTPAYRLIIGGRRIAAYRFNDQTHIPAFVRAAGEPATVAATRLVENIQRTDLSPLDEAAALHELTTSHGKTQAEVARLIGRNQGHVSKRLALLKLGAKGAAMLNAGLLPLDAAGDIAKLPAMLQNSVLTMIQGGTTPEAAVRQARAKVAELKERGDLIKRLNKAQTPVIDRAEDRGPIPDDARRVQGYADEAIVAAWEADPGRLAEVRRQPDAWRQGDDKWLVRYTTTPAAEQLDGLTEFGGAGAAAVSGQPQSDDDLPASEYTRQADERLAQYRAAEQAREARLGELRDFVRTLINGKISDSWARFLVRLSLVTALAGDPDEMEGCPAAVSSAGEALDLPKNMDYDLAGFETLTAVLGHLQADDAPGTLLRLALGGRLLNGLRFLGRPDAAGVVGAEVLAFLRSQGVTLTEGEAELADRRSWRLEGVCVEYEMVQPQPDVEEPALDGAVETEGLDDDAIGDLDVATGEPADDPVKAAAIKELFGQGSDADDFDGPVETFRPDHAGEANLTGADIEGMTRPALIELAAARNVETTPRMTRLQLAAALKKALLDPADDIA